MSKIDNKPSLRFKGFTVAWEEKKIMPHGFDFTNVKSRREDVC